MYNCKPYIQFQSVCQNSVACPRAIKFISPLKEIKYGKKTVIYCNVYTKQEYYENGEPIFHRTDECMIAFGACAKALQSVDYLSNRVTLEWFINYKHQNVIFRFMEFDESFTGRYNHGKCKGIVSEFKVIENKIGRHNFTYANYPI